ncbi:MAG: hypothetical protein KY464_13585 [Gemmatimonadetes bacterium]|nr:hypothetical protein [Gemmatimonadota bacterium]
MAADTRPAASFARTCRVYAPSGWPNRSAVNVPLHAAQSRTTVVPRVSRHSLVPTAVVKAQVGVRSLPGVTGPLTSGAASAELSMTWTWVATAPTLPAASTARTVRV